MKRNILSAFAFLLASTVFSQTVFEAVKTSQNDIIGTARYMSVAGAFGALGGDVSAIKDNPAGLGIFRKSELTATVDAQMQTADALWNTKKATDSKYSVGMNNLSLVLAGKTWRAESGYAGLVNSNFSFSYNKLQNFNRNITVKGNEMESSMTHYFANFTGTTPENLLEWDSYSGDDSPYLNTNVSWMAVMANGLRLINPVYAGTELTKWSSLLFDGEKVSPTYQLRETGGINEYSFGWSGNFSNRFFVGATLNLQSIDYQSVSNYKELFQNDNDGMTLQNTLITTGTGANVNIGIIAVPVDFIRFGLSLHTPMFYSMEQLNYASLDYFRNSIDNTSTPTDNYAQYQLQTPLQFNVSTAFILDKRGFLSAEYVYNNYTGMKFIAIDDNFDYTPYNEDINGMLKNARTIKVGGEYRLTDSFSLRAGFANTSSIANSNIAKILDTKTVRTDPEYFSHNSTNYATFGLGYRESNWYFDFAYINKVIDEDYFAYNSVDLPVNRQVTPANVKTSNNNIVATFGIKF